MRQRKDRKKIGPLEVFLLLLLAVSLFLQLAHDPNEGKYREIRQMQTWQAQPVPTWWAGTQTAFWSWKTPTPDATLTPTPTLRASAYPGKVPEADERPTVTGVEERLEDDGP